MTDAPSTCTATSPRGDTDEVVAADGVVDTAEWLAARPCPRVHLPGLDPVGVTAEDAGWRVRVALLDGPVRTDHPDLRGARVTTWDGVHGLPAPAASSESTAYAALLVGQGRTQVRGLVPAAHLLVAPVLGVVHQHTDELVARAVHWALAEGANVLVLPFGRRRMGRRLAVTLRHATASGATVFAAAGDRGPYVMSFPASVTGVVAVTGHDDGGILPQCSALADLAVPAEDVPGASPEGLRRLTGSAPAAVLAAGAHAARLSELSLAVYRSLHGSSHQSPATRSRHGRDEARQRDRLVDV